MSKIKKSPDIIKSAGENLSGFDGFDLGFGGIMTGFGGMLFENEEQRKKRIIGQYKDDDIFVSTVYANDTNYYETAIQDERYHDELLIVQEYADKDRARGGHEEWVHMLLSDPPAAIKEIRSGDIYLRSNNEQRS